MKEVAHQVERKVDTQVVKGRLKQERFLACISSNAETAKNIIRKTARLASHYDSKWFVLYVQTPEESADKINLSVQRHLINNLKLAAELGAEVLNIKSESIAETMIEVAENQNITTICIGKPHFSLFRIILATNLFNQLLKKLSASDIDLIILS